MNNTDIRIAMLKTIIGIEEVKHYTLINNEGYTFTKHGKKYDLRHWRNVYGAEVDFWSVGGNGTERSCDTFDEAIKIIIEL